MKENYEDDRCVIPEEIQKLSDKELKRKISQFEQEEKPREDTQASNHLTHVTLPYHLK